MTAIMDYWPIIASLAAFVALVIVKVEQYRKLDADAQAEAKKTAETNLRKAVSDWLLKAVIDAETELGTGTGKLKIRSVYERAIEIFGPTVYQVITLEQLDAMAQYPLEEMRHLLETNGAIADYVAPKASVDAIGFEIPSEEEYDE